MHLSQVIVQVLGSLRVGVKTDLVQPAQGIGVDAFQLQASAVDLAAVAGFVAQQGLAQLCWGSIYSARILSSASLSRRPAPAPNSQAQVGAGRGL